MTRMSSSQFGVSTRSRCALPLSRAQHDDIFMSHRGFFYGWARARLRPAPLTTVAVNTAPDKTVTDGVSVGLGASTTHSRNTQPISI